MEEDVSDYPDIDVAMRSLLLDSADLASAVGTRVYSDQLPQTASLPAVVFYVVSEVAEDVLSGPLGNDQARFQIDCFGRSRTEANQIWQMARVQIAGKKTVIDGVSIVAISQASGHREFTERPDMGSDFRQFVSSQDFFVRYHSLNKVI
jgi:hypothetical protein